MVEYEVTETIVVKKRDLVRRCDRCGVEISRIVDVDHATEDDRKSAKRTDDAHQISLSKKGVNSFEVSNFDLCDRCLDYVFDLLAAERDSWNKDKDNKDEKEEVLHK